MSEAPTIPTPAHPRPTLAQLARKAGVHHTTVSRALRNHPGIPEATRSRIKAIAEEMSYRPDPFLSALANYRKNVRGVRYQATLAWIMPYESPRVLKQHNVIPEYLHGAARRADELGYGLDEVWLKDFGRRGRGVSAMLRARGISGLLIPPQLKAHEHLHLDWEDFAAVSFGFSLTKPVLLRVANDQYGSIFKLTRHLVARGFRRPALVIPEAKDERVRFAWSAAFRSAAEKAGLWRAGRLFRPARYEAESLHKWLGKSRPDVLIALDPHLVLPLLEKGGISVPGDLSLAGVALRSDEPLFGGVTENGEAMGAAAVEILSGLMHRGERGIPAQPRCVMIEGNYHSGQTIASPV
jgi:LacI family transcriptional regulator